MVDVVDLEIKRRLREARDFYMKIFPVMKVETLDEVKVVLKYVIKEQKMSVNQSNEIKNLKKLLE